MADADFFVRRKPYATEQLTVSTAVATPTASKVDNTATPFNFRASAADVEVGSNGIIYTLDGSTPTATNGLTLASAKLTLAGYQKVKALKMIRSGGSDATVNITYYKE
jgi:hypothetical protein